MFRNIISSPELKAKVSFSNHLLSQIRLSVRLSVNILHFQLLQNQRADINQTWAQNKYVKMKGETLFQGGII